MCLLPRTTKRLHRKFRDHLHETLKIAEHKKDHVFFVITLNFCLGEKDTPSTSKQKPKKSSDYEYG